MHFILCACKKVRVYGYDVHIGACSIRHVINTCNSRISGKCVFQKEIFGESISPAPCSSGLLM